jgi:mannose-6-phosphate isomerase-like protein (cupin superfamily)
MNMPNLISPLAGHVLGSAADSFVMAEWQDQGGPAGQAPRLIAPPHVHHHDEEAWYVLEGTLVVRAGTDELTVTAGSAVLVRRGTAHTYWNPGPERVRYLLLMTPNIYQLIQDIHALQERTPEALREVFRKHDSELL